MIVTVLQPTYLRVLDSVQRYLKRQEFDITQKSHWDQIIVTNQDPLFVAANGLLAVGEGLAASKNTITEIFGKLRAELVDESCTVPRCQLCCLDPFQPHR